ncbi:unnamed protein product, partial [Ectocarpus fasciculatus]
AHHARLEQGRARVHPRHPSPRTSGVGRGLGKNRGLHGVRGGRPPRLHLGPSVREVHAVVGSANEDAVDHQERLGVDEAAQGARVHRQARGGEEAVRAEARDVLAEVQREAPREAGRQPRASSLRRGGDDGRPVVDDGGQRGDQARIRLAARPRETDQTVHDALPGHPEVASLQRGEQHGSIAAHYHARQQRVAGRLVRRISTSGGKRDTRGRVCGTFSARLRARWVPGHRSISTYGR